MIQGWRLAGGLVGDPAGLQEFQDAEEVPFGFLVIPVPESGDRRVVYDLHRVQGVPQEFVFAGLELRQLVFQVGSLLMDPVEQWYQEVIFERCSVLGIERSAKRVSEGFRESLFPEAQEGVAGDVAEFVDGRALDDA